MRFSSAVNALLLAIVAGSPTAIAQNFPSKPLRMVAGDVGGASDRIAREAAQGLSINLGQPITVTNFPGIQSRSIMEGVKAAPDGYTVLAVGANQFWLAPYLQDNVPYDPVRDLAPVTLTGTSPVVILAHPSLPASNVRELIALAKARPGELRFGYGNTGSAIHLAGELFKSMSKTNIVGVNYKGTDLAIVDVITGELQLVFPTVSTGMPAVKAGKLRALAVTTARPSPLAPGLPSANESGLPGYDASVVFAVFAPLKTPDNIVGMLNRAMVQHLQSPEIKQKLFAAGLDVVASSPSELAAAMQADMDRMSKVIREAGLRPGK